MPWQLSLLFQTTETLVHSEIKCLFDQQKKSYVVTCLTDPKAQALETAQFVHSTKPNCKLY